MKPMPKIMKVEMPKGCLNKNDIQEDILEIGKYYEVTTLTKRDKFKPILTKLRMKLIGCYPNHYVFEAKNKRKHSFMKVDYHLKEWECKEI